jgi:hypothetical protein
MNTNAGDNGQRGAPAAAETPLGLGELLRGCREVPAKLRAGLETNPVAVVGSIAAGGFVLGALFGSRLGRVVVTAAVGFGVNRFLEGPAGRELGELMKLALKPRKA